MMVETLIVRALIACLETVLRKEEQKCRRFRQRKIINVMMKYCGVYKRMSHTTMFSVYNAELADEIDFERK